MNEIIKIVFKEIKIKTYSIFDLIYVHQLHNHYTIIHRSLHILISKSDFHKISLISIRKHVKRKYLFYFRLHHEISRPQMQKS